MEKGSFSLIRLRWLEVVDGDLFQKDGFSVGEGGRY